MVKLPDVGAMLRPGSRRAPARAVGLDVGGSSLKLVELERGAGGVRIVKHLIQELPTAPDGEPIDRAGWLHSALKEFDAREVHVAISGPEVVIRRVDVPLMSAAELPEAVRWTLKDQVPFPIAQAAIAVQRVGEIWDKDIKKQDVVVAVAPSMMLQELSDGIERSGVRVASMTPTLAACAASCLMWAPSQAGSVAVVDLGGQTTHVAIIKDGRIRVARDLAIGSASMTEALMGVVASEHGERSIDLSLAESLKRRYGVLPDTAEGSTEEGVPFFHIASLMRPVLEQLLIELSRLFDFYKMQLDTGGVARVVLCGGGANLKGLQQFLADGLGLPVEMLNPLTRAGSAAPRLDPEQAADDGARIVAALGAALDHGQTLNLAPRDLAHAAGHTRRVQRTVAVALAVALAIGYVVLQGVAAILDAQIRRERTAWTRLEPAYAHAMETATARRRLETTLQQVKAFGNEQPVWHGLLKELSHLTPPSIMLESLRLSREEDEPSRIRLSIDGRVMGGGGSELSGLPRFVEELEDSIFFRDVVLASSEMRSHDAQGKAHFEIEGWLE